MYAEDDLLPIASLQHLAFCTRQWALMYLERQWEENRLTAEGRLLHERVHSPSTGISASVRIARALPVRSLRLGLVGIADVVEFRPVSATDHPLETDYAEGDSLDSISDWRPYPIEYKRGKPKPHRADEIQLCAQALCLEEMIGVPVPEGAIFYNQPHRRTLVTFDDELRRLTEYYAALAHKLFQQRETPAPKYEKKCRSCSLFNLCLPKLIPRRKRARRWLDRLLDSMEESGR